MPFPTKKVHMSGQTYNPRHRVIATPLDRFLTVMMYIHIKNWKISDFKSFGFNSGS